MPTPAKKTNAAGAKSTARKSESAPAKMPPGAKKDLPVEKAMETNALAESMETAAHKLAENGHEYAVSPLEGAHIDVPSPLVGASTLTETNQSDKVGTFAGSGTLGGFHSAREDHAL